MKYYCGLDVSLNKTAICIVDDAGKIIREGEAATEPEAIDAWLRSVNLPIERAGLEAGSLSPWLCQELIELEWPAICIETRHAKAAMSAQPVKTDRNDARGLAQIMRTGWFREVHIKSQESMKLRMLLQNRRFLLAKRFDIDNHIRGSLKAFGLKVGNISRGMFEARVRELIDGDADLASFVLPMLEARQCLIEQCADLEKQALRYVKYDSVCRRFMTIPGVGPLTALIYKTYIDRPERFRKSQTVGAALGLTPRKYASGEIDYDGQITKCGDVFVRSHLFEAAKVLLTRSGKKSALQAWGLRVARRSTMKKACVAVARRLSVIMHAMWRDGTEFRFSDSDSVVRSTVC